MIVPENPDKFFKKFFDRSPFSRAFLLIGEPGETARLLQALLPSLPEMIGVGLQSSTLDWHAYKGEALAIDDARDIHEKAHQTSWSNSKVFLINTDSISFYAQAVLLKTLEEPSPNTYFIISAKSDGGFSAPLLSRLVILKPARSSLKPITYNLELSFKKLLEEASNAAKERGSTHEFLDTLEIWVHNELKKKDTDYAGFGEFIEDLLKTKARFFEKTYFNRMLLEHIIISQTYILRS